MSMEIELVLDKIMGIDEAAQRWGLDTTTIRKLCASGKLPARLIGKTWILHRDQERPDITSRKK